MKITQYTSRNNYSLFGSLREILSDYIGGSSLASRIAKRDIRAQYRQSLLGFAWVLIIPIASTALWVILQQQGVLKVDGLSIPYPVFALTGVVLWQLFVDALNSPLNMFKQSKSMLTKINFPREALILAGVYKLGFNLVIKLAILAVVYIYYDVVPDMNFLMIPVGIFSIMFLGLTLGILITPMGVLYNDVQQFLQTFIRLFFFLTPIIYLPSTEGILSVINTYNPVGILITDTRLWMTGQEYFSYTDFGIIFLGTFLLFTMASIIYKISMPIIIERIGA